MEDFEAVIEQLKKELGEDKITTTNRALRPQQALDREMWHNCLASSTATANLAVKTLPVIPAPSFSGFQLSPRVRPQRTHRARNCDVTVRVSRQLTVLVPVRQQAKCEAKH